MAIFQILGLAPAKRVIRKWFRRLSPAGSQAGSSTGAASSSSTDTDTTTPSLSQHSRFSDSHQPPTMPTVVQVQTNAYPIEDKENRPPDGGLLAVELPTSLKKLSLQDVENLVPVAKTPLEHLQVENEVEEDPKVLAERARHLYFIGEALDMARLALRTNETPVGCVLVHNDTIIAKGMNATNVTRNGTRHAEFMAISALLSWPRKHGRRATCLKPKQPPKVAVEDAGDEAAMAAAEAAAAEWKCPDIGNEDGKKGHLYPYGQRFHPNERLRRDIIRECDLYVTVEPCVMCASLLRQLGIRKVYFGAVNDKFGGTGGVFSIHANSHPVSGDGQTASAHPIPRQSQLPDGSVTLGMSYPPGGGDGGNVESGYEIEGGWGRDEAVGLLRRFYVQENGRAPVPRKKEGRAARLAAMMEQDDAWTGAQAGDAVRDDAEQLEVLRERPATAENIMMIASPVRN